MKTLTRFAMLAALVLASAPSVAQDIKSGDLTIVQPWSRATPKGATVGAAYLTIRNSGAMPDRLLSASTDVAHETQVHEMTMEGGIMKMRQLAAGLEIPAGSSVDLKPNGYHLMLMQLNKPLAKGEKISINLLFEHAGKVPVVFQVGDIGDMGPAKPDGAANMSHDGMKMDHGSMDMKN